MIHQLLVFVVSVTGVLSQYDCSNVNCDNYSSEVIGHGFRYEADKVTPVDDDGEGFRQCRMKIRQDNLCLCNKTWSGIQILDYKDFSRFAKLPGDGLGSQKPTIDCPPSGELLMTESPRLEDLDTLAGDDDYKNCCAKKAINECYYKVTSYFDCGARDPLTNDRVDDRHIRTDLYFENIGKGKSVSVSCYPEQRKCTCRNSFNAVTHELIWKKNDDRGGQRKSCGDFDVDVKLYQWKEILGVTRYRCISQYMKMNGDPSHKDVGKILIRTDVNPLHQDRYKSFYGDVKLPVLAQTRRGVCGKHVKSVTITKTGGK